MGERRCTIVLWCSARCERTALDALRVLHLASAVAVIAGDQLLNVQGQAKVLLDDLHQAVLLHVA